MQNGGGRDRAAAPNPVWLADLTCIPTDDVWPCLAAIPDMHIRKIVDVPVQTGPSPRAECGQYWP